MVFESLLQSKDVEKSPWEMLFYGILVTSIALWTSYFIFPEATSLIFLFLITIAAFPVIYNVLKDEEEEDEKMSGKDPGFFERHNKVIWVYSYLFIGVIIGASFWFSVLPESLTGIMFEKQISTITSIQGATGQAVYGGSFLPILLNNIKVTFIAFIMSFFFGTGAIFIITWNASVIAVFLSRTAIELSHTGTSLIAGHFFAFFSIALHGIPEVVAYFIAGIAGGILSIGVIKGTKDALIIKDALLLFGMSVFVLVIAAAIEAFITPIL